MGDSSFLKIIVVGEQNVGKTCILARYSRDMFDSTSPPTLGMDFQSKLLEYKGSTMRLQLWDIAGQERYSAVSKLYVRGACGAIIVTDVKQESTLQSSLKWKKMIEEACDWKNGKPIPMILAQNKVDELKGVGQIQDFQTLTALKNFATTHGFNGAMQVSAKENTNIPDLFNLMIDEIYASGILSQLQEQQSTNKQATGNFSKPAGQTNAAATAADPRKHDQSIKLNKTNTDGSKKRKKADGDCC